MIISGNNSKIFKEFKKNMTEEFEITDIGEMSDFFNVEVTWPSKEIFIKINFYLKFLSRRSMLIRF